MKIKVKDKVGVIGAGRFGRVLMEILTEDFEINYYDQQQFDLQIENAFQVSLQEVVALDSIFLCVPIVHFESALKEIAPIINPKATVLDVLSVKVYANQTLENLLPATNTIIPTHPMFGPFSIKEGRENLPFVLCPTERSGDRLNFWTDYFASKNFNIVEMTCDEHDQMTAHTLCVSQMIGRLLEPLDLKFTSIDTPHHFNLVRLSDIARSDSWELFEAIQTYNPYAKEMHEKLKGRLDQLLEGFDYKY